MCWEVQLQCIVSSVMGTSCMKLLEVHSGLNMENLWERHMSIKRRNRYIEETQKKETSEQATEWTSMAEAHVQAKQEQLID